MRIVYFLLLAGLLGTALVHAHKKFVDYPVYETAGTKILQGRSADLYDRPGQPPDGFYYAFVFALLFAPIAALGFFGRYVMVLLFFLAYVKTLRFSVDTAFQFTGIPADREKRFGALAALFALTLYAVNDGFLNANIGPLLLALAIYAFEWRKSRPWLAGTCLGLAVAIKTYPVLLLGYFIWEKRFSVITATVVSTAFFLFGVPILALGWTEGSRVIEEYAWTLGHFESLWGSRGWHYGGHVFQNIPGTVIRYGSILGVSRSTALLIGEALGLCALVALFLPSFLKPREERSPSFQARMYVIALAAVPLLTPVSWYNMALFYAPAIAYVACSALYGRSRLSQLALALYVALYCLTTPDIVGRPLNAWLAFHSIPWLGLMALLFAYWRGTSSHSPASESLLKSPGPRVVFEP